MEARRLKSDAAAAASSPPQGSDVAAARAPPQGGLAPYFAPIAGWFTATDPRAEASLDLAALNALAARHALRTESGRPIRFVEPYAVPVGAYERVVHETGCVPTRTVGEGMLHDWFNALAWLAFPHAKARLNAVHAAVLAADRDPGELRAGIDPAASRMQRSARRAPGGRRGRVRDAATLFDESGAVFVCRAPRLRDAFVARDWTTLFVRERASFVREVRVVVFGHALFEKLLDPYKSICAHAVVLDSGEASIAAVDAALATRLEADVLATGMLHPLPLLGVPGWCAANEDPSWYDDPAVFRRERRRSRAAGEPCR